MEIDELLVIDLNRIPIIYESNNFPSWLKLDPETATISGTPLKQHIGIYDGILVKIRDGVSSITVGPFSIQVRSLYLVFK